MSGFHVSILSKELNSGPVQATKQRIGGSLWQSIRAGRRQGVIETHNRAENAGEAEARAPLQHKAVQGEKSLQPRTKLKLIQKDENIETNTCEGNKWKRLGWNSVAERNHNTVSFVYSVPERTEKKASPDGQ